MSEENTQNISGRDERSFEERVFARFDAMETRMSSGFQELDARLQRLEARSYDTKPMWEQTLKHIADMNNELVETRREVADTRRELVDTKRELVDTMRQLSRRLDRIESVVLEVRSDLGHLEDRVGKLEAKPTQ